MLNWIDPMFETINISNNPTVGESHAGSPVSSWPTNGVWCDVCGLDTSLQKSLGIKIVDICERSSNFMARCNNCECGKSANTCVSSESRWLIFKIMEFSGISCFKIAHNNQCIGMLTSSTKIQNIKMMTHQVGFFVILIRLKIQTKIISIEVLLLTNAITNTPLYYFCCIYEPSLFPFLTN